MLKTGRKEKQIAEHNNTYHEGVAAITVGNSTLSDLTNHPKNKCFNTIVHFTHFSEPTVKYQFDMVDELN